jgi:hypothetical protein
MSYRGGFFLQNRHRSLIFLLFIVLAFVSPSEAAINATLTCQTNVPINQWAACQFSATHSSGWPLKIYYVLSNYTDGTCWRQNETNTTVDAKCDGPGTAAIAAVAQTANLTPWDPGWETVTKHFGITIDPPTFPNNLSCPQTLNPLQTGQCSVNVNSNYSVPNVTWQVTSGGQVTPNGATADVSFTVPGQQTVTAVAEVDILPNIISNPTYQVTQTAVIDVPAPQLTVSVNCTPNLWTGETGSCMATGWSSWGTIGYMWSAPNGTITGNGTDANVIFGQSGIQDVTVTAYLIESPTITSVATTQVDVTAPQITLNVSCPSSLWPGETGGCTSTGTSQWGTLQYNWTSTGTISGSGNSANVVFPDVGPGSVTVTASLVEAPSVQTAATAVVTISDPQLNVQLNCPSPLWITESGTCTVTGSAQYGTIVYTWSSTGNLTDNGTSADVDFSNSGQQSVTVTASLLEAPSVQASQTANITVNSPQVTAALSCPQTLWVNSTGTCTVNATTTYGTLQYNWVSSGNVTPSGQTADVSFAQGGTGTVDVTVSLLELPNIQVTDTANITVNAPQINATVTCPQQLWVNQAGTCTVNAATSWGTLQYNWSISSGTVTPNGTTADVAFAVAGTEAVTVDVSLVEIPNLTVNATANVDVQAPAITASISCPASLWKNQTGTCTVNATTTWGTLQYSWTSNGTLTDNGNTADVTFSAQGNAFVNATVSLLEAPMMNQTVYANIFVDGYKKPYFTISGPKFVRKGETHTYDITNVYSPSGPLDITWDIDGVSNYATGNQVTYTFNTVKKVPFSVAARIQGSGTDPDGENTIVSDVTVSEFPKPLVSITKDRRIFINQPTTFTANVYTRSGINNQVIGRWVLPDRTYGQGTSVTYTFTDTTRQAMTYEAWYSGYPDRVTVKTVYITALNYQFPDFTIYSYRGAQGVVPYVAIFKANADMRKAVGKQITYDWDFGDGTTVTSARSRFAVKSYDTPGTYPVTLNVTDEDGNIDNEILQLTLTNPPPITLAYRKSYSNPYMRAPINAFFRALKSGGHPRDRISTYDWKIDGTSVSQRAYLYHPLQNPGSYNVSLDIVSRYGLNSTYSEVITVNPNQPPVCDFTWQDRPRIKLTYFTPDCTDSDGRIVRYDWDYGNNTQSHTFRGYGRYTVSGTYDVILTATDDIGAQSSVTKTVTVARP